MTAPEWVSIDSLCPGQLDSYHRKTTAYPRRLVLPSPSEGTWTPVTTTEVTTLISSYSTNMSPRGAWSWLSPEPRATSHSRWQEMTIVTRCPSGNSIPEDTRKRWTKTANHSCRWFKKSRFWPLVCPDSCCCSRRNMKTPNYTTILHRPGYILVLFMSKSEVWNIKLSMSLRHSTSVSYVHLSI